MSGASKKEKRQKTGVPSAVVISILIHAGIFAIAGAMVIVTAVKKAEKKFVPPPPIERPKMDLKKPRVKVKKASKPRNAKRITSAAAPSMPDVQLPDVSGIAGSGLGGDMGGYDLVPDVSSMSLFGDEGSAAVGNDFQGTFYLLNRTRDGKDLPYDREGAWPHVAKFINNDWSPYAFSSFYRSPKKLYATQFLIPLSPAMYGPRAFGIGFNDLEVYPEWVVHYKGKISSKKGGRYRFWGTADQILFVRIKGELVLDACIPWWEGEMSDWESSDPDNHLYCLQVNSGATIGDWFTMEPGEVIEMEVLMGNLSLPHFGAYLLIEDEEESSYYSHRPNDDMPILPYFRTADMSEQMKDIIKYNMYKGDADLEGGEVFNVY